MDDKTAFSIQVDEDDIYEQMSSILSKTARVLTEMPLDALIPYERNSNHHSDGQVQDIALAIEKLGFNDPIQVNEGNVILAGEGRFRAAKLLGLEKVPVLQLIGMSEEEQMGYRIAHNKLNRKSYFDNSILRVELMSLEMADLPVPAMSGFSESELKQLGLGAAVDIDIDSKTEGKSDTPSNQVDAAKSEFSDGDIDRTHELTMLAGYQTAICRTSSSAPIAWYQANGLLHGDVLDYGCGQDVHSYAKFDPAYYPDYSLLQKRWDTITCNYVLNVLPLEHNRVELLLALKSLLEQDGKVLISIYIKSTTDSMSSCGFQCGWKPSQWEEFFGKWFSSVAKLPATFNCWLCLP